MLGRLRRFNHFQSKQLVETALCKGRFVSGTAQSHIAPEALTVVGTHTSGPSQGSCWFWPAAAGAAALLLHESEALAEEESAESQPQKSKGWNLLSDSTRRRTFFKYEKRIRDLSPPDKVFDYFASQEREGGSKAMKPADLLCALVSVYPPDLSACTRTGKLAGEQPASKGAPNQKLQSDFFRTVDSDGDGLLSFQEYMMIITLLSIPEQHVATAFQMMDLDDSGFIDFEEFQRVCTSIRSPSRPSKFLRTGMKLQSEQGLSGIYATFFGQDGSQKLSLDRLQRFLNRLHLELVHLEFSFYDENKTGFMTGKDFARSVVAGADVKLIDPLLNKVDELEERLASYQVSEEQFEMFVKLERELQRLEVAIELYNRIADKFDRSDLQRACRMITGHRMDPELIDIIFHMFDTNQDGSLASKEFILVLRQRSGVAQTAVGAAQDESVPSFFRTILQGMGF
ncbi:hypothetical protein WJX84_012039 [Apatococcus fuscideae]|uniref:EF-hand domain-containing protein n=1 Tax=Apatococcus fuscideae TaxID=2026836 RepID=A0AAW1SNG9_9CHLO